MKNIIVSLGAGLNQIPLIKKIKEKNYFSLAFDLDNNAPGKKIADKFVNISSHDYKKIIDYIEKKNLEKELKGVLTRSTGNPVLSASKIAEKFNLTYTDKFIGELITDKYKLIENLNNLNIPAPLLFKKEQVKFPVFIKPSKTNKSHLNTKFCDNKLDFEKFYKNAKSVSENSKVNIEEYMKGYDTVSIDFVVKNEIKHICSIGELNNGKPNFKGIGWFTVFENAESKMAETFKAFVEKLNVKNGFFQTAMKTDLKFENSKIYEIHGEIGGDFVTDSFIPKTFGNYDLFLENINFVTNKEISFPNEQNYCVLIFNEAISLENVKSLTINYEEAEGFYFFTFADSLKMEEFLISLEQFNIFYKN